MRREKDFMGTMEIPDDALYGIHSWRAFQNFNNTSRFSKEWYQAMGNVKRACYNTYEHFRETALKENSTLKFTFMDTSIIHALQFAADEVSRGKYYEQFIVPAIQGGAGTSINMNINEIIANVALIHLGYKTGDYHIIDPIEHANIFQSTNDTVTTALKIACMKLLEQLEENINLTRSSIESLEKKYQHVLRMGYTQMQEAVPTTFGKLFSSYNDALSRDWWRVSKCQERIKVVNLGGGAIGTGLSIPRFFIMEVVNELQHITQLPIARGENLTDTTQNMDSLVEVHATVKAHAVNLEKIASDIRMLAADAGHKLMNIPAVQAGSSIMPGKVNPVINEFVISAVHQVYSNDVLISNLCGQGCLELNAYIPSIGHALLDSLSLLIAAHKSFHQHCLNEITVDAEMAEHNVLHSPSITTALIPYIGYHKATELALFMKENNTDIFSANQKLGLLDEEKIKTLLSPDNLTKLGFSIKDV